jgi:hypothetical protein
VGNVCFSGYFLLVFGGFQVFEGFGVWGFWDLGIWGFGIWELGNAGSGESGFGH